jgi:hypothetical protein
MLPLKAFLISNGIRYIPEGAPVGAPKLKVLAKYNICSEFLARDAEVPGSTPGATRYSEQ